jgi:hypothetical protein
MNEEKYYISIKSTSLAHYFGNALILPSRFYKNKPSDIQNTNSDYLILSKDKFLNESNCSIEIILNKKEVNSFLEKRENNIFFYKQPIPISRINKIFFLTEEQKIKTVNNINRGTAFIPKGLIEIKNEENIILNISDINDYIYSKELEKNIKTYNQLLGGLAFVRYKLDDKNSDNYFSILYYFNDYIAKKYIDKQSIFKGYNGAFTYKGKVWDILSPLIYKDISDDIVIQYAKDENLNIVKSLGVFKYEKLENINSITYKLAILNTYGEKNKRKTTNDLIFDCQNKKIPKEKQEGIALIYGINNGYSSFRNKYDKKIVKFKMDSLLDYYTIESVFQYAINGEKNNGIFEYIDAIFSIENSITPIDIPSQDNFKLEKLKQEFQDFKEHIYKEIRELKYEIVQLKKDKFDEEKEIINIQKDLEKLLVKDLKSIAQKQKIKGRSKMRKAELIEAIRRNS